MNNLDKFAVLAVVMLIAIWWSPLAALATGWKILLTFIVLMMVGSALGLGKALTKDHPHTQTETQSGGPWSRVTACEGDTSAPHGLRVGARVKYNDPSQGWVEGTIRSLSSTDSGTAGLVIIELADGTTLNLPPAWLVSGLARRDILLSTPSEVSTEGRKPAPFEFGEGTKILQFAPGREECYENHLRLIEELKARNAYPNQIRVFALKSSRPGSAYTRLIVTTGPLAQWNELARIYYSLQAESFVEKEFGGNWMAINASSNVSSVADPGCSISDPRPFRDRAAEIQRGDYIVERRIA